MNLQGSVCLDLPLCASLYGNSAPALPSRVVLAEMCFFPLLLHGSVILQRLCQTPALAFVLLIV